MIETRPPKPTFHIPLELITKILRIEDYYMVNKELMDLYLKFFYSHLSIPRSEDLPVVKLFRNNENAVFSYSKYVCKISFNFTSFTKKSKVVDGSLFENATTSAVFGDNPQFPTIIKTFRNLSKLIINNMKCHDVMLAGIANCKILTQIDVALVPGLEVINNLPLLTTMVLQWTKTSCDCDPLVKISTLTVITYDGHLNDKLHLIFPNTTSLTIENLREKDIPNEPTFNFDGFLQLAHLNCKTGKFKFPKNLKYLTYGNNGDYIQIPSLQQNFYAVTLVIKGYEKTTFCFEKCLNYLKSVAFKVDIIVAYEMIFSNRMDTHEGYDLLKVVDGVYLHCKLKEKCSFGVLCKREHIMNMIKKHFSKLF